MELTLTHGTVTKPLADWGFTAPILRIASQTPRSFSVLMPSEPAGLAAAAPIPFNGFITVSSPEAVIFSGRRTTVHRTFSTRGPGLEINFQDALWDMSRLTFQQTWKHRPGPDPATDVWFSRLNLFQDYDGGGLLTTGQQIAAIVSYAAAHGVTVGAGTIDDLASLPIYPVKGISCADAIRLCLRPVPDAQLWVDPATNLLHCRARANLVPVSLPWKDGTTHESGDIVRRDDLEVPAVQVQYQQTFDNNGRVYTSLDTRTCPPSADALQPGALVIPIDLRGGQRVDFGAVVESDLFDPTNLNWWIAKKPDLGATSMVGLTMVGTPTILDEDGAEIPLGYYPNELLDGDVMTWMVNSLDEPVVSQKVTVRALFAYTELDAANRVHRVVTSATPHEINVRVTLTNSEAGVITYTTLQHYDPGEPKPTDLETYLYNSLSQPQYQGSHILRLSANGLPAITDIYGPWNSLNLTGGDSAWSTMIAAVQSVMVDFTHGQQSIDFGPPAHLSPDELWSFLQNWSYRQVFDAPDLRISAEVGGSGATLGGVGRSENTTAGTPLPAIGTVQAPADSGGTRRIRQDAQNGRITLETVADSSDAPRIGGQTLIQLALSDLTTGDQVQFRAARIYRTNGVDGNGDPICQYADVKVLMSEPTWTDV